MGEKRSVEETKPQHLKTGMPETVSPNQLFI